MSLRGEPFSEMQLVISKRLEEFKAQPPVVLAQAQQQVSALFSKDKIAALEATIDKQTHKLKSFESKCALWEEEKKSHKSLVSALQHKLKHEQVVSRSLASQVNLHKHQQSVCDSFVEKLSQVSSASEEALRRMFEESKLIPLVKRYFAAVLHRHSESHQESMQQLQDLQAAKRREADSLQATIQTLKRVYSGKTSEDKFSRLIECLESQISILKEAKSDYCQQLERIKLQPVDSGVLGTL